MRAAAFPASSESAGWGVVGGEWREAHGHGGVVNQEEPDPIARYVELLKTAFSPCPYNQDPAEEVLDHLMVIDDPLITLATISMLVRDPCCGEWDVAQTASLFYGSPGGWTRWVRVESCFMPDVNQLKAAWEVIEEVASLCVGAYKRQLPGASLLAEDSALSSAFWNGAFADESLRTVVRGAFLAGVGKDIRLLDAEDLDSIEDFAQRPGYDEDVRFLVERLGIVLFWIDANLSREQVCTFPALVDLSARILVRETIETADMDTVSLVGESASLDSAIVGILSADLEGGVRAVCRAYDRHWNPEAQLLGERLLDLGLDGEVEAVLRRLSSGDDGLECKAGAVRLLAENCDDED